MKTPLIIIGNESRGTVIKKWIAITIVVIITVSGWFAVPALTNPEKEQIISTALETPEGREAFAKALIEALDEENSE